MLFKRQVAVFLIPGLICFAACPAWAEANKPDSNVESDTQAKMQLDQMASKLASAKRFSVSMLMNYDVVQESGQKIQFSEAVVRLRKSEFFALFHHDTMESIDEPTQIILKEFITPLHQELIAPSKNRRI